MSAGEELLEEYDGPGSGVNEAHIVVNRDRSITVPDSLRKIGVQYDHNVETLIFDCPRYWDDVDLSTLDVFVNYMRADGAPGKYDATKSVSVDESDDTIMHFEWKISKDATMASGPVVFSVCAKKVDEEGNDIVHWNADPNEETYIVEGLEPGAVVEEMYPDIVTSLLARMAAVEKLPPVVQTEEIEGGYRITVTDINGTHTVEVKHGDPGPKGDPGVQGAEGVVRNLATGEEFNVFIGTEEAWEAYTGNKNNTMFIRVLDENEAVVADRAIADEYGRNISSTYALKENSSNIKYQHNIRVAGGDGTATGDVRFSFINSYSAPIRDFEALLEQMAFTRTKGALAVCGHMRKKTDNTVYFPYSIKTNSDDSCLSVEVWSIDSDSKYAHVTSQPAIMADYVTAVEDYVVEV